MNATEAKTRFLLKNDLYSAYFTDSQISAILNESLRRVIERAVRDAETDTKAGEELSGLEVRVTPGAPTTTTYHTKPADWKYPWSIRLKYVVSGTTYYEKARRGRAGDASDPFEEATVRYPRYSLSDGRIYYEPSGASEIDLVYLKEFTPIDITGSPSTDLPVPPKMEDLVIDEAVKVASAIQRDGEMYGVESKEVVENP